MRTYDECQWVNKFLGQGCISFLQKGEDTKSSIHEFVAVPLYNIRTTKTAHVINYKLY